MKAVYEDSALAAAAERERIAEKERERLLEKARKWREQGMFTENAWGAVMAVLFVSDVVTEKDKEWAASWVAEHPEVLDSRSTTGGAE